MKLALGTRYLWFVSLVTDPEQRSKDFTSGAWIERRAAEEALRARLAAAGGNEARVYAAAKSADAALVEQRAALLEHRERLDVFNGFLLAPHIDAAFDCGLLTVGDDGAVIISRALNVSDRHSLGLSESLRVRSIADGHRAYLSWLRAKVFRGAPPQ